GVHEPALVAAAGHPVLAQQVHQLDQGQRVGGGGGDVVDLGPDEVVGVVEQLMQQGRVGSVLAGQATWYRGGNPGRLAWRHTQQQPQPYAVAQQPGQGGGQREQAADADVAGQQRQGGG